MEEKQTNIEQPNCSTSTPQQPVVDNVTTTESQQPRIKSKKDMYKKCFHGLLREVKKYNQAWGEYKDNKVELSLDEEKKLVGIFQAQLNKIKCRAMTTLKHVCPRGTIVYPDVNKDKMGYSPLRLQAIITNYMSIQTVVEPSISEEQFDDLVIKQLVNVYALTERLIMSVPCVLRIPVEI